MSSPDTDDTIVKLGQDMFLLLLQMVFFFSKSHFTGIHGKNCCMIPRGKMIGFVHEIWAMKGDPEVLKTRTYFFRIL